MKLKAGLFCNKRYIVRGLHQGWEGEWRQSMASRLVNIILTQVRSKIADLKNVGSFATARVLRLQSFYMLSLIHPYPVAHTDIKSLH